MVMFMNDDILDRYYDSIDWKKEWCDGDVIGQCPICETDVIIHYYGKYRESSITQCQTSDCFRITSRGL